MITVYNQIGQTSHPLRLTKKQAFSELYQLIKDYDEFINHSFKGDYSVMKYYFKGFETEVLINDEIGLISSIDIYTGYDDYILIHRDIEKGRKLTFENDLFCIWHGDILLKRGTLADCKVYL